MGQPSPAEPQVSHAPDVELVRDDGLAVRLATLWQERPLVLVFLGDLANPFTSDQALNLRDGDEAFAKVDADIAAIVTASPEQSLAFRHKWGLPYPLLTDEHWTAGRALGVSAGSSTTFVIDTDGAVRYARRASNLADYPPTVALIAAVCEVSGADPPPPPPPVSLPVGDMAPLPLEDAAMIPSRYTCAKCGHNDCEQSEISTAGGFMSRMLNMQHRKFVGVSCRSCGYTELYRRPSGMAGNVADVIFGG